MKRLISLFAVLLLLLVAGCGGGADSPAAENAPEGDSSVGAEAGTDAEPEFSPATPAGEMLSGMGFAADGFEVEFTSKRIVPAGEEGNIFTEKPALALTYTITNIDNDSLAPNDLLFYVSAFQADQELELAHIWGHESEPEGHVGPLAQGDSWDTVIAYELNDESTPVELVAIDERIFGDEVERFSIELP